MARGRFISRSITTDRAVSALSSDTCRLAFTWLITLADVEGRTTGEPELLLAELFPRRREMEATVMAGFIEEWVRAGFVVWYADEEGERYLQLNHFARHQAGLRKSREGQSAFPAPQECHLLGGAMPE